MKKDDGVNQTVDDVIQQGQQIADDILSALFS